VVSAGLGHQGELLVRLLGRRTAAVLFRIVARLISAVRFRCG
jgi:hypothetical protein